MDLDTLSVSQQKPHVARTNTEVGAGNFQFDLTNETCLGDEPRQADLQMNEQTRK